MKQSLMQSVNDDINVLQNLVSGTHDIFIQKDTAPIQTNMVDIARPYSFRPEIDPTGVAKQFLHKKMGIVEIIPCNWAFPIKLNEIKSLADIVGAQVLYEKAISTFQRDCQNYGLNNIYSGVRLHLTSPINNEETISHSFNPNILDSTIDSIRQTGIMQIPRLLNRINRSTQISKNENVDKFLDTSKDKISSLLNITDKESGALKNIAGNIMDVLVIGQKISFPKIWQNTSYTPSLNVNIRLFCPFGHPLAIKQFIIDPLCYLILLCGSQTHDGMSYGYPRFLSVRGYGSINLPLASCNSISWRRGGDDNNFSIYKQPTVVDVTISCDALIDGFGYYSTDELPDYESTVESALYNINSNEVETNKVTFMTLGNIINSFKPYLFEN